MAHKKLDLIERPTTYPLYIVTAVLKFLNAISPSSLMEWQVSGVGVWTLENDPELEILMGIVDPSSIIDIYFCIYRGRRVVAERTDAGHYVFYALRTVS